MVADVAMETGQDAGREWYGEQRIEGNSIDKISNARI